MIAANNYNDISGDYENVTSSTMFAYIAADRLEANLQNEMLEMQK